jgi:NAD-dependent histone deacetylase SIR2
MGTSLTVQPFASLADRVDSSCPRVLINLDHVGSFGSRSDDVILLGKCDEIVRNLSKELGWEDELVRLWDATEATLLTDEPKLTDLLQKDLLKEAPEVSDTLKEIEKELEELALEEKEPKEAATTSAPESKDKPSLGEKPSPDLSPSEGVSVADDAPKEPQPATHSNDEGTVEENTQRISG